MVEDLSKRNYLINSYCPTVRLPHLNGHIGGHCTSPLPVHGMKAISVFPFPGPKSISKLHSNGFWWRKALSMAGRIPEGHGTQENYMRPYKPWGYRKLPETMWYTNQSPTISCCSRRRWHVKNRELRLGQRLPISSAITIRDGKKNSGCNRTYHANSASNLR